MPAERAVGAKNLKFGQLAGARSDSVPVRSCYSAAIRRVSRSFRVRRLRPNTGLKPVYVILITTGRN